MNRMNPSQSGHLIPLKGGSKKDQKHYREVQFDEPIEDFARLMRTIRALMVMIS